MATPNYKGTGQPAADGGSWLGSWLGGTPAYKGTVKLPSGASSGPGYKAAPAPASSADVTSADDSDACGSGPIAIVIPREVIDQ